MFLSFLNCLQVLCRSSESQEFCIIPGIVLDVCNESHFYNYCVHSPFISACHMYPHVAWGFFIGQMFLPRSILFVSCSYIYWKFPTLQNVEFHVADIASNASSTFQLPRLSHLQYVSCCKLFWLVCGMKLGALAKGDFSGIVGSVLSFQWGVCH